jgi:uncharacterized protein YidB (DUF937 family)
MTGLGDLLGGLLGGSSKSSGGGELGSVLGGLLGGKGRDAVLMAALLPIVVKMLRGGGLSKILAAFQQQGLAAQANSWVGKGANKSVSADQVTKVIGSSQVAKIAKKVGVSQGDAASALAKLLPRVIDHVSPEGQALSGGNLRGALKQLAKAAA